MEDEDMGNFTECKCPVITKTLRGVLLSLVEHKTSDEMKGKKGCLVHDGWSRVGVHYVAVFTCYMITTITLSKDGEEKRMMFRSYLSLHHLI